MKQIINRKVYNTDTAELVAEFWNHKGLEDWNSVYERLYITQKGSWFLYQKNGTATGGIKIVPFSEDDAYNWLEKHGKDEQIEKYFSEELEDA